MTLSAVQDSLNCAVLNGKLPMLNSVAPLLHRDRNFGKIVRITSHATLKTPNPAIRD